MALFATTESQQRKEILSRLREIAATIQPFSDRKLAIGYEGAACMGEAGPFYHISYPVTILDHRHPLNLFTNSGSKVSAIILAFEVYPASENYQINKYLTDEVKEAIRSVLKEFHPGVPISEVNFG